MKVITMISGLISVLLVISILMPKAVDEVAAQENQAYDLYAEGKYGEAAEILEACNGDRLILGNTYYRMGEQMSQGGADASQGQDASQVMTFYQKALDAYKEGIEKDPERVEVKFNYEWVEKLLEQEENQQEQADNQEESDKNDENQGDNQEESDKNDENQGDDQEESDKNDESQGDDQEESDKNDESQGDDQEESGKNDENQGNDQEEADQEPSQSGDVSQEEAVVNQILQMLENQEEESLKNNQEVVVQGQGDGNDW